MQHLARQYADIIREIPFKSQQDGIPPQLMLHSISISALTLHGPGLYHALVPYVLADLGEYTDPRKWLLWTQLVADAILSGGTVAQMSLLCVVHARRKGLKVSNPGEFIAAEETRRLFCRKHQLPDPGPGPALSTIRGLPSLPWLTHADLVEEMTGMGWAGLLRDGQRMMDELQHIASEEFLVITRDGLRVVDVDLKAEYCVSVDDEPSDEDEGEGGEPEET